MPAQQLKGAAKASTGPSVANAGAPIPSVEALGSLSQRIDAERVHILYSAAPFNVLIHLLASSVLGYALREAVDISLLVGWYVVMLLVCFSRWGLQQGYRDAVKLPGESRVWEVRFAAAALLTAVVWSALVLFLFPAHSVPHQMLVIFVVASLAIGSAGAVQASVMTFVAYVATTLTALFLRLMLSGQELNIYAGLLVAVSLPACAILFFRLHKSIQESLVARFEKEAIAEDLQRIELKMNEALLEETVILDTALVGIAFIRERRILRCNRRMEELFGFGAGELASRSTRVLHRSDQIWNESIRRIDVNLQRDGIHDEEMEFFRRDGVAIWCRYAGRLLERGDASRGAVWIFSDVTKRREAEQGLSRANAIIIDAIESIPDAFAIFDREDRLIQCNLKYLEGVGEGVSLGQARGMTYEQLVRNAIARGEPIPPEFDRDTEAWVAERLRRHHQPDGDYIQEFVGGRWIQARDRRTAEGGIVSVRTDITALKRNQDRAEFLANHDPLTELPNRRLLEDRLRQALGQARRNQNIVALMVVDLDRFKSINDNFGHRIGDEVLRESALRLRACVREVDTVSRMGGDEFVIVLSELRQASDAALVAQKIFDAMRDPYEIEGHVLQIACSIGIAQHLANGEDPDALLKAADFAMYRAKEAGRNRYQFAEAGVISADSVIGVGGDADVVAHGGPSGAADPAASEDG